MSGSQILNAYSVANIVLVSLFPITASFPPLCTYFFAGSECEMTWDELEVMVFAVIVGFIKNRKAQPGSWLEYTSPYFLYVKLGSSILLCRRDIKLGSLYIIMCIVVYLLFPEPVYAGPDKVEYFSDSNIQDEITRDKSITWLIAFYTPWSNTCVRLAPVFAQLSLEFANDKLKFGKVDISRFPEIAKEYKINTGVMSKQIPTVILFEGGKEITRRPAISVTGKVLMRFFFTKENLTYSFDLNELSAKTRAKCKTAERDHTKQD
ncbi:Thioredoxin-related transmembrane protein 2-like protein [Trichoplax sp. H2]|nr:Thioredoxin-related transmembrane protein 2-like protein [Trichoplax sp. H2]|eukprot:RDD47439.1 Thioredoxin-related transmembrane protein 2-like protein [Trichoplax sp. H2]